MNSPKNLALAVLTTRRSRAQRLQFGLLLPGEHDAADRHGAEDNQREILGGVHGGMGHCLLGSLMLATILRFPVGFDRNGGLHENPGQFERLWDSMWRDPLGIAGDHPMREYLRLMDQFVPGTAPSATTIAAP